jgi:hypothetical protein
VLTIDDKTMMIKREGPICVYKLAESKSGMKIK